MRLVDLFKIIVSMLLISCSNGEPYTVKKIVIDNASNHDIDLIAFGYRIGGVGIPFTDTLFVIKGSGNEFWSIEMDGKSNSISDFHFLNFICDSLYVNFDNERRLVYRLEQDKSGRSIYNSENYRVVSQSYKSGITHTLVYTITNEDFENALLIE